MGPPMHNKMKVLPSDDDKQCLKVCICRTVKIGEFDNSKRITFFTLSVKRVKLLTNTDSVDLHKGTRERYAFMIVCG